MKKFTSLFALLSCLCVVSAQAVEVKIHVFFDGEANNPRIHYWDANGESNWNATPENNGDPYLTQETINGIPFYTYTLNTTDNNGINIILRNGNNQTNDIPKLKEPEYYITYATTQWENGKNKYYFKAILSLGIAGIFNGWNTTTDKFTFVDGAWTYIWNPNGQEPSFKLLPNSHTNWTGYSMEEENSIYPVNWFYNDNDGNFHLKSSNEISELANFSQFKITATWSPNDNVQHKWALNVEGIGNNQYTIGSTTYTIGETNNLDLSSDQPFSTTTTFTATTATYTRNNGNNKWGTLCLPFSITNPTSGVTFYQLSNVANNVMTFTPYATSTIPAGTPIAFKLDEGNNNLSINETNASVTGTPATSSVNWTMSGTFQRKTLDGIYYIYNDKYYYGSDITAKPYRAWIVGPAPSNNAPFRIEEADAEGLQFVEQEDGTVKAYYDLQGRKLDGARKGLVIENGKIIMVK